MMNVVQRFVFFFFNDTATTEIYTLSLHDALPIFALHHFVAQVIITQHYWVSNKPALCVVHVQFVIALINNYVIRTDRKSTRLNSSHANISYAVFCLKKKKNKNTSHKLCIQSCIII